MGLATLVAGLMAATRIEIERTGFGWSAEIDAPGVGTPRIVSKTFDELLGGLRVTVAQLELSAKRAHRVEPTNENPPARLAPPVSRRSIARLKREQRESQKHQESA